MRIKLYLFLPLDQAKQLVRDGFPNSSKKFRLNPANYTACSAFNPKSLIEIVVELERAELERYRREMELPIDDEASNDEDFGAPEAEPIYWYDFPASELRKSCRAVRIVTGRHE